MKNTPSKTIYKDEIVYDRKGIVCFNEYSLSIGNEYV